MKNSAKDRLVNGLINFALAGIFASALIWLVKFYYSVLSWPTDLIFEHLRINWWFGFLLISLAAVMTAYLSGNYSVIDLIKWRSKKKIDKKKFFSIRLKYGKAAGHSEEFDGHIEGYVTESYMTKNGMRYNATVFISGWTVLSRLLEEEFVRTHKNVPQLIAYYFSGGKEYVDDEENESSEEDPITK